MVPSDVLHNVQHVSQSCAGPFRDPPRRSLVSKHPDAGGDGGLLLLAD
jgi:hypothetical protein